LRKKGKIINITNDEEESQKGGNLGGKEIVLKKVKWFEMCVMKFCKGTKGQAVVPSPVKTPEVESTGGLENQKGGHNYTKEYCAYVFYIDYEHKDKDTGKKINLIPVTKYDIPPSEHTKTLSQRVSSHTSAMKVPTPHPVLTDTTEESLTSVKQTGGRGHNKYKLKYLQLKNQMMGGNWDENHDNQYPRGPHGHFGPKPSHASNPHRGGRHEWKEEEHPRDPKTGRFD